MRGGMLLNITSRHNPKIRELLSLRDKRHRDQTGLFLIEGYRELSRAVDHEVDMRSVFICPELFLGKHEGDLIGRVQAPLFRVPAHLFETLSYRDRPDGLIGIAQQMPWTLAHLQPEDPCLYVIAESIEKPGNLGTILRSSDGVGARGLIVCDRCTDLYNPNVVRASVGTLFTLPVVQATTEETIAWLRDHGIQIIAATPSASVCYTDAPITSRVAMVVGAEQVGLSPRWLQEADMLVSIPMKGVADSLNVATAATLLLYDWLRRSKGN